MNLVGNVLFRDHTSLFFLDSNRLMRGLAIRNPLLGSYADSPGDMIDDELCVVLRDAAIQERLLNERRV